MAEILAWRGWRISRTFNNPQHPKIVVPEKAFLESPLYGTRWDSPVASVPRSIVGARAEDWDKFPFLQGLHSLCEPSVEDTHCGGRIEVAGWVALSGKVVECERGYIAETMTIRALYTPYDYGKYALRFEELYQCSVIRDSTWWDDYHGWKYKHFKYKNLEEAQ